MCVRTCTYMYVVCMHIHGEQVAVHNHSKHAKTAENSGLPKRRPHSLLFCIHIYIYILCAYIYTHVFACTSIPTVLTNTQVCVHVVLCVSVKPRVLGHVHLADLMRQQLQHTLTNRHGIKHRSNQTNKQTSKQTNTQPSNTHKQTKQIETNTQPIKQHKPTNKHTYKQTNSLTLTLTLVQMSAVNAPQHCVDPSLIAKQRH